jgi:hypothetical protein
MNYITTLRMVAVNVWRLVVLLCSRSINQYIYWPATTMPLPACSPSLSPSLCTSMHPCRQIIQQIGRSKVANYGRRNQSLPASENTGVTLVFRIISTIKSVSIPGRRDPSTYNSTRVWVPRRQTALLYNQGSPSYNSAQRSARQALQRQIIGLRSGRLSRTSESAPDSEYRASGSVNAWVIQLVAGPPASPSSQRLSVHRRLIVDAKT